MLDDVQQVGTGAHRRVDHGHVVGREAERLAEAVLEEPVDKFDHAVDDLHGRVVRAGLLAQLRVVDLQELLVQVQVRVVPLALLVAGARLCTGLLELAPVDRANDAEQRVDRPAERAEAVVGEDREGLPHEAVAFAELTGDLADRLPLEADAVDPGEQQRKGDGLGVAVGELLVVGVWEQQLAPVSGEARERPAGVLLLLESLGDLVPQQPAQRGDAVDELGEGARGEGLPPQERVEHPGEAGAVRGERGTTGADVALEPDHVAQALALAVDRPLFAVGVEDVRQPAELLPLDPVVALCAPVSRVRPLAGGLHLDVADEGAVDLDGVVGTELEVRQAGLADRVEAEP